MLLFCIFFINAITARSLNPIAPSFSNSPRAGSGRKIIGANPEELGDFFEGDITNVDLGRNGLISKAFRWPRATIPYVISGNFNKRDRALIFEAMNAYRSITCVRFRQKVLNDVDFVDITNKFKGCYSAVGKVGGRQVLNLQTPGCMYVRTITHELLHAIGFFHEQSRSDRDEFVKIQWENVAKGHEHNFKKYNSNEVTDFQVKYDYNSIMHYTAYAFSKNNKPTMVPTKPGITLDQLGRQDKLSLSDILKIRRMYNCR